MNILKELKWSMMLMALSFIVLGIVVILYPHDTMRVISYILAIALIMIGIVSLINYIRGDIRSLLYRYDLVVGFSTIIGGILIILNVDKILAAMPVVLGFLVTISGILKLQNAIDMIRLGSKNWQIAMGLALINIVFGIILLINPFSVEVLLILLGVGFIYSGITDIYATVIISILVSKKVEGVKDQDV